MTKKTSLVLIIAGAALGILLCLFFGGFGWWALPGLIAALIGAAGLVSEDLSCAKKAGCYIAAVGLAVLAAAAPYVMMGVVQVIGAVIAAVGIVIAMAGKK